MAQGPCFPVHECVKMTLPTERAFAGWLRARHLSPLFPLSLSLPIPPECFRSCDIITPADVTERESLMIKCIKCLSYVACFLCSWLTDFLTIFLPKATVDLHSDGTVEEPVNREAPMSQLISSWITTQDHYDRNHGPIQHKQLSEHKLKIDGIVARPASLTIQDLQTKFLQAKITCALLCAGNRRHTMRTRIKEVSGIDWFDGAIMNCVWEGPRLRDVLIELTGTDKVNASEKARQKHVQFASYGSQCQDDSWFGGSIPFERAMDPEMDVILAIKVKP